MANKHSKKQTRTYDQALLMEWALGQESLRKAKSRLADAADVSVSLAEKLFNGTYAGVPRPDTRQRIARVIGKAEDLLFPLVGAKGRKHAS
jgi:transcriptional regulator with XRE-family HTH domain